MIEDLRFIEREMPDEKQGWLIKTKILQAYDGYIWFDVPLVRGEEEPTQSVDKE